MGTRRYITKLNTDEIDSLTEDDDFEFDSDHAAFTEAEIRAFDPPGATGRIRAGDKFNLTDGFTPNTGVGVVQPFDTDMMMARVQAAYIFWRKEGRTEHWRHLRTGAKASEPLTALDKWAFQLPAVMYNAVKETYPENISLTGPQLEALADHLANVLETLGPTWYFVMVAASGSGVQNNNAEEYAGQLITNDGTRVLYTDTINSDGTPRDVDGSFTGAGLIPSGYNPELPGLVNP